jgi:hypothetical protein
MSGPRPAGVPAAPNASQIRGRLVGIEPNPEGPGSIWEIAIEEARDVEGMANFAQARVGQPIQVYVQPQLRHNLATADEIEARVTFRGDERGGSFFLIDESVRKV